MTTPYQDPNNLHNPATGANLPANWGDSVRDGLEYLIAPPMCVARRTVLQSIPNAAWTPVQLTANPDLRDTDSFHDPAGANPERFNIPSGFGGWYRFTVLAKFDSGGAGSRNIGYAVSGGAVENMVGFTVASGTSWIASASVDVLLSGNGTEYITANVYQDGGGALNMEAFGGLACRASLVWVGRS